jgi:hypothetical protein
MKIKPGKIYSAYNMRPMYIVKKQAYELHIGVFVGQKEEGQTLSFNTFEEAAIALLEKAEDKQLYTDGVAI